MEEEKEEVLGAGEKDTLRCGKGKGKGSGGGRDRKKKGEKKMKTKCD